MIMRLYGVPISMRDADMIDICCEACGGEGVIFIGHPNNPNPREEPCQFCERTGRQWVKLEPIEMEDLEVGRRDYYDKSTEAENEIRHAVFSVEKLGADERLTQAINLLHMARNLVADFVDGVNVDDWKARLFRELDEQRHEDPNPR